MEREVWLPIQDSNRYEASNLGRIRNAETLHVLRPAIHRGYEQVNLYFQPQKFTTIYVHALVLKAFCGPPPFKGAEVCHNDGNKANNRLSNLRWGSRSENMDDRVRHHRERFGTGTSKHRLSEDLVRYLRREARAGRSIYALAKEVGVSHSGAWDAVVGRTWKHVEGAFNPVGDAAA